MCVCVFMLPHPSRSVLRDPRCVAPRRKHRERFRRKDKVSLKTMERYLKHVSVPTLCWAEIRSQAGLRHLDLSDNLADQEYDRVIEVSLSHARVLFFRRSAVYYWYG